MSNMRRRTEVTESLTQEEITGLMFALINGEPDLTPAELRPKLDAVCSWAAEPSHRDMRVLAKEGRLALRVIKLDGKPKVVLVPLVVIPPGWMI